MYTPHSLPRQADRSFPPHPRSQGLAFLLFLAGHAALAPAMRESSTIATIHAIATLLVGTWAAARWRLEDVMCVIAYITGAEVLWRMTGADVFWEIGKYAIAVISIGAALRLGRFSRRQLLAILYVLLLVPSLVLVDGGNNLDQIRQQIAFNLSGPLALAACAFLGSQTTLSPGHRRRLSGALVGPVLAIAVISLLATLGMSSADFTTASNFRAAGGFGPNQVSSILGLAALTAFLSLFDPGASSSFKALMLGVMILSAVQSALTFSRGGLYCAMGAALLASLYLLRSAGSRVRLLTLALVLGLTANRFLWPRLDAFTQGKLSGRFQSVSPTRRDALVRDDLRIWLEHPVRGVGPGELQAHRTVAAASAHSEFSRLLAEHGLLGIGALLSLLAMCRESIRRTRTATNRAQVVALFAWSFLYMSYTAMRTVAPSFVFGLACAQSSGDPVRRAPGSVRRQGAVSLS